MDLVAAVWLVPGNESLNQSAASVYTGLWRDLFEQYGKEYILSVISHGRIPWLGYGAGGAATRHRPAEL